MTHITQHRIWHLGADVDTDALAPGAYMQHGIEVIAAHCLENVLPNFAHEVRPGDVLVAGANFGIGSSREQAAAALLHLGVKAVIAPSYGGLFFRNAFNLGLLLLTCPQLENLKTETEIELNLNTMQLITQKGKLLNCDAIPDFLLNMVQAGGLLNQLKQHKQRKQLK
jgi:3-isopropylmalate/(R)-2-methylmalate dehydratase small subunit